MSIETYIVDSFTSVAFKGNPAGVCVLKEALPDEVMQSIAKELGLSETAFLQCMDGSDVFSIRYFSPKMEIPLCGHATLAASKVLFDRDPHCESLRFKTVEDLELAVGRTGERLEMEFPVYSTVPCEVSKATLDALGIESINNSEYNKETNIILIEIQYSDDLRSLKPDFERLKRSQTSINGVLVTAASKREGVDFESRYFWPWSGTNEDPVTGGTHTFLAGYWSTRLKKVKMHSFQCSERTGSMEVEVKDEARMMIRGEAQIVLKGELML